MPPNDDFLIFTPDDVDLARSPLRGTLDTETFVLGAFNPGFTRLPNGNLLLMVRVAEGLRAPVLDDRVRMILWEEGRYRVESFPLSSVHMDDPRQFLVGAGPNPLLGLTSLSWLLPVELTPDGRAIVTVHYDRAIEPAASFQCYGIEDARISRVGAHWYMTVCSVSPERQCTSLYMSDDGLNYRLLGVVLDHQNKDMILFEGKVAGKFMALTRPMGGVYLAYPEDSPFAGGPSINFAQSPDGLHWKPLEAPGLRPMKNSISSAKLGGGSPPVLTPEGWLVLYHGVEPAPKVGTYRTFWAVLDRDDPSLILRVEDEMPLMEAKPELTRPIAHRLYLPTSVVFTTGIVDDGDDYIVASGEADLACRITRIPKSRFDQATFSGRGERAMR